MAHPARSLRVMTHRAILVQEIPQQSVTQSPLPGYESDRVSGQVWTIDQKTGQSASNDQWVQVWMIVDLTNASNRAAPMTNKSGSYSWPRGGGGSVIIVLVDHQFNNVSIVITYMHSIDIVLHCITFIELHRNWMHCIALFCFPFYYVEAYWIALDLILLYCIVLHCIA